MPLKAFKGSRNTPGCTWSETEGGLAAGQQLNYCSNLGEI